MTGLPTWGSGKGTENPQWIWLWRPVGFDYRTSTGLGKQTLGGNKQSLLCNRRPHRDWARHAFECLNVSCGGRGSAMACHRDRGTGCRRPGSCSVTHHRASEQMTYNRRTIIPKKFSHCWESCRTHNRFPNLGIWQRDGEPPGNLTLEASGIWLQNFHRTGETYSWRAQTKPSVH